jgi:hydrogenase maturation protein HypF
MQYAADHPSITRIPVQHHHAHIVSCMAENKITGDVIGLAFDGTGYGSDGNIWGGEILVANAAGFKRSAHLSYSPMPGGASAVKEPWRIAVSYLFHAFGDQLWDLNLPLINQMDTNSIQMMIQMISKQINSPLTSSLGRLFDGVAAIMGVRSHVNFEGQAAMALEMLAGQDKMNTREAEIYTLEWTRGETKQISVDPLISGIVTDMSNSIPLSRISAKFHLTIIDRFSDLCNELRKESKINYVALSGGAFQNSILLTGFTQKLTASGFKVISHTQVPANDGGLSLGQAVAAAAMARLI